jgi:flagellar hook protein FlgE
LAITGNGFFATVPEITSRDFSFTRAGQFKLDSNNFVVNSQGENLLGFPVNTDGTSASVALSTTVPVRIPDSSGSPQQTTEVDVRFNLPAGDQAKVAADFDPSDPLTYNAATSVTVYDSLGDSHVMTYYFIKDNDPAVVNEWYVATAVDDQLIDAVNSDGSDSDPATAVNTIGGNTGNAVTTAKIQFSEGGDFIGIQSADGLPQPDSKFRTEALGPTILSTNKLLSTLTWIETVLHQMSQHSLRLHLK